MKKFTLFYTEEVRGMFDVNYREVIECESGLDVKKFILDEIKENLGDDYEECFDESGVFIDGDLNEDSWNLVKNDDDVVVVMVGDKMDISDDEVEKMFYFNINGED